MKSSVANTCFSSPLLGSFFIGGFEGSTGYNLHRTWFDQVEATGHDVRADEDYKLLRTVGMSAARECVRWPLVERAGGYDFSSVAALLAASRRHHVDVIWDLFHYGYPADIDLFSPEFPERFARYCEAAALYLCPQSDQTAYFTPINEASFFAWVGAEVGDFAPYLRGCGPDLKVALARAAIAGINAIRAVRPRARIVNVDPLCHVLVPPDRPDLTEAAAHFNEVSVFETFDMICGRLRPDLGGTREHLDLIGLNYYRDNQWYFVPGNPPVGMNDHRRVSLVNLLMYVWRRYGGELLITETGDHGDARAAWMNYIADECAEAISARVPLRGACLYPVLGMPHWHDRQRWERMGLWDLIDDEREPLQRRLFGPMFDAFRKAQLRLEPRSLGPMDEIQRQELSPSSEENFAVKSVQYA